MKEELINHLYSGRELKICSLFFINYDRNAIIQDNMTYSFFLFSFSYIFFVLVNALIINQLYDILGIGMIFVL